MLVSYEATFIEKYVLCVVVGRWCTIFDYAFCQIPQP